MNHTAPRNLGFEAAPFEAGNRPAAERFASQDAGDLHVLAARWSEKARRLRESAAGGHHEIAEARLHETANQLDACAAQLRAALLGVA